MKTLTEDQLIELAIKGNQDAWKEVYSRYYSKVKRVVGWSKWGYTRQEVEEIVQEVFLELVRALPSFRKEASLSTFLTRLSKNKCISVLRKKGAQKRVKEEYGYVFEDKRNDPDEKRIVIESSTGKPEFEAIFGEETAQLMGALKNISEECQQIIKQRFFCNYSYNEICESLNLPLGTVCSRLKRCLLRLKEIYEKNYQY
jgi:RNA polymerase sigma-70 factor, ECF subfamily